MKTIINILFYAIFAVSITFNVIIIVMFLISYKEESDRPDLSLVSSPEDLLAIPVEHYVDGAIADKDSSGVYERLGVEIGDEISIMPNLKYLLYDSDEDGAFDFIQVDISEIGWHSQSFSFRIQNDTPERKRVLEVLEFADDGSPFRTREDFGIDGTLDTVFDAEDPPVEVRVGQTWYDVWKVDEESDDIFTIIDNEDVRVVQNGYEWVLDK